MKQLLAIIATVTIYLGSVLLIDSAIAKDHHEGAQNDSKAHAHKDGDRMRRHEGKGKGPRRDHSPVRMLFRGLDLNDEQKDQVGSIMREQMEKGRNQRETSKSETRDRLAAVLTEEQLGQFDLNARRMERMKSEMDRKKGGAKGKGHKGKGHKGKGSKHKKKGKHKPRPQHN